MLRVLYKNPWIRGTDFLGLTRPLTMASPSPEALQTLQIAAISLACLTGLFGVYVVIFVIAIWATYRQTPVSSKILRWVTIALFIDLSIHFISRSLQFARARRLDDSKEEFLRWGIPLTVITKTYGTLAWRFYVVYNKKKWALYLPATAFLCWSADGQHLAAYSHPEFYKNTWSDRSMNGFNGNGRANSSKYATAIRAVIESAVVTWIGIVLCEIGLLAPTGHITADQNMGTVILNIVPDFFGISQCLITAQLGLAREMRGTSESQASELYSSLQQDAQMPRTPTYRVSTSVTTVTDQDYKST
ncbi:hypothetical protein F5888DRAFT_1643797 [Russula emetica]|nr:hypothetical protein F5888DRAFT_1643797 [Russula emetica]